MVMYTLFLIFIHLKMLTHLPWLYLICIQFDFTKLTANVFLYLIIWDYTADGISRELLLGLKLLKKMYRKNVKKIEKSFKQYSFKYRKI